MQFVFFDVHSMGSSAGLQPTREVNKKRQHDPKNGRNIIVISLSFIVPSDEISAAYFL